MPGDERRSVPVCGPAVHTDSWIALAWCAVILMVAYLVAMAIC